MGARLIWAGGNRRPGGGAALIQAAIERMRQRIAAREGEGGTRCV